MRFLRSRASVLASLALCWQILALMFIPTVLCGQKGTGAAAHEAARCPMHHAAGETCPMHEAAASGQHASEARLGCAQIDNSFLALFGPVGVLPSAIVTPTRDGVESAVVPATPSSSSLAPVPVAPPPRA